MPGCSKAHSASSLLTRCQRLHMREDELFGVYNSRWTPMRLTPDFISVRTFLSLVSASEQFWDLGVMLATS